MEALVFLDRERENQQRRNDADRFWNEFLSHIAARADNPFVAMSKLMPDLGIELESDKPKEYALEDQLPPPQQDEIADLEAWMRDNAHGTISGSDLKGPRP